MKKNGKYSFFIFVAIIVIAFVLGCSSTPKITKVFVPAPKHLGLSQLEMKLNDTRMHPANQKISNWLGSRAPSLSEAQVSVFVLHYSNRNEYRNVRINGILVEPGYLFLEPGRQTVRFAYHGSTIVSTGIVDTETVNINIPNVSMEIDMLPGKVYRIEASISETDRSLRGRHLHGYSVGQFTVEFSTREYDWERSISTSDYWTSMKFLEPYDSSIPVSSQAFLQTRDNIYIVGFNGEQVRWGWGLNYTVTIGVPPGSHMLRFIMAGDDTIYTTTVNCVPGSYYVLRSDNNGGIRVSNITLGHNFNVIKTNETFDELTIQSTEPAIFEGPTITVVNNNPSYPITYLFISPTADSNWGVNRLRHDQVIKKNQSITLQLPHSLSLVNRYDIMVIRDEGKNYSVHRMMDVDISTDNRFVFGVSRNWVETKAW